MAAQPMRWFRAFIPALILASGALAQTGTQFEVASIKPSAPNQNGMFIRTPPGRLSLTNMTLKEMIVMGWRIQPFQVSGGPPWLDSIHYDVNAKAESQLKPGEIQLLLQSLLADRFQLVLRRETKELPVYAMVLAKKDGKLGPGLVESKIDTCPPPDPTKAPVSPEPGKPIPISCGQMRMSDRHLSAMSVPVTSLIPMLSRHLERTVINQTGLTAKFDISLEWAPDNNSTDASAPSIFTALQEQLGLKLESQKGPVAVFVVERAEKPSEN